MLCLKGNKEDRKVICKNQGLKSYFSIYFQTILFSTVEDYEMSRWKYDRLITLRAVYYKIASAVLSEQANR